MDPHPFSQWARRTHKSRTRNSGGAFKSQEWFYGFLYYRLLSNKVEKIFLQASVIYVLASSAICSCYLILPNKVKYHNDITLSVTQHFWRPKGQLSRYHRLQGLENCQFTTLLCKIRLWNWQHYFYKSVKFQINIFYSPILRVIHIMKQFPYTHMSRLHHHIFKIEYKNHYNHFFTKIRATYYFYTPVWTTFF